MRRDDSPLCPGGAFPADPDAVAAYGADVLATGEAIAEQVRLLRRCADPANWSTETADAFRDKAQETADRIDAAKDRYLEVGSRLTRLARDLQGVHEESWRWVRDARDADDVVRGTPEPEPAPLPDGSPGALTPEQQAQQRRRHEAAHDLAVAQGRYDACVEQARELAAAAASDVRRSTDDGVRDNWWERHAGFLQGVATALGVVAAAAGLVLLFCSPVGWVFLVAMGVALAAGAAALTVDSGLAAFAGGSWWKPAFDLVGLLTLGTGGAALRLVGRALPGLTSGLASLRGTEAFLGAMDTPVLRLGTTLSRTPFNLLGLAAVGRSLVDGVVQTAFEAERVARAATEVAPVVSRTRQLLSGGVDAAEGVLRARQALAEATRLTTGLPTAYAPQIARVAADAETVARLARLATAASALGTLGALGSEVYDIATFDGSFGVDNASGPVSLLVDALGRLARLPALL